MRKKLGHIKYRQIFLSSQCIWYALNEKKTQNFPLKRDLKPFATCMFVFFSYTNLNIQKAMWTLFYWAMIPLCSDKSWNKWHTSNLCKAVQDLTFKLPNTVYTHLHIIQQNFVLRYVFYSNKCLHLPLSIYKGYDQIPRWAEQHALSYSIIFLII